MYTHSFMIGSVAVWGGGAAGAGKGFGAQATADIGAGVGSMRAVVGGSAALSLALFWLKE